MNHTNDIITLPEGFDGTFRFTNASEDEFTTKWGNVAYTFPPMSTTPLVIPSATPLETQNIRKKFAKDWAVLEFYKSEKFKALNGEKQNPALYTDSDLEPLIEKCLTALPIGKIQMRQLPNNNESKFRKDSDGAPVTKVLDQSDSLVGNGTIIG